MRPGGVRSFPLLALSGALLYELDTARLLPLTAGLLVLGAWLTCYYWRHVAETDAEGHPNVGLMVPICNVLAYLIGPIALAEPPWMAIGVTVVAVLQAYRGGRNCRRAGPDLPGQSGRSGLIPRR